MRILDFFEYLSVIYQFVAGQSDEVAAKIGGS